MIFDFQEEPDVRLLSWVVDFVPSVEIYTSGISKTWRRVQAFELSSMCIFKAMIGLAGDLALGSCSHESVICRFGFFGKPFLTCRVRAFGIKFVTRLLLA